MVPENIQWIVKGCKVRRAEGEVGGREAVLFIICTKFLIGRMTEIVASILVAIDQYKKGSEHVWFLNNFEWTIDVVTARKDRVCIGVPDRLHKNFFQLMPRVMRGCEGRKHPGVSTNGRIVGLTWRGLSSALNGLVWIVV